jgi:hypothetical protein
VHVQDWRIDGAADRGGLKINGDEGNTPGLLGDARGSGSAGRDEDRVAWDVVRADELDQRARHALGGGHHKTEPLERLPEVGVFNRFVIILLGSEGYERESPAGGEAGKMGVCDNGDLVAAALEREAEGHERVYVAMASYWNQ